ncbi:uncharacterized protein LOC136080756 [Hydra vulgaris]|uniref:Uncharacterized protein LOC136080756 n=1 Tax=Hydra vulgaris TaxID=6087 RepID=A0ABM4BXC3_HYDVU
MEKFNWEPEAKIFVFHEEVIGKPKMHTKRLDLHDWIKIDNTYVAQQQLKKTLLKTERDKILVTSSNNSTEMCKWEFFQLIINFLPKRFPDLFEERPGCIFNKVFKEEVSTARHAKEDLLVRISSLTQEDWVILEWSDASQGYVLTAGVVFFPMRWSLKAKFNKVLVDIHAPVAQFTKNFTSKAHSLMKSMSSESPIWRANWSIFNDLKGPLDLYAPIGHLERNERNNVTDYFGEGTGRELTFRVEYQTLRKLPETQCIVFSIRSYQRYLEDFKQFPLFDSEGLLKAIENLNEDEKDYKGAVFWSEAAKKYLKNNVINTKHLKTNSFIFKPSMVFSIVACSLFVAFVLKRKYYR